MGKQSREKQEKRLQSDYRQNEAVSAQSSLERVYFKVIEWGIYVGLFTPLILNSGFFFPYVSAKTLFFRGVIDVIFIAYILLVFSNRRYAPRLNALTLSLISFLGVAILTSATGVNFEKSFWSVFERMGGILTMTHLFAFFIILTSVFREKKYWERFFGVSILVGIILTFYVYNSSDPTARGGGTVGNTSFLSAYLLFDVFFALILFLSKSGVWKFIYGFAMAPLVWLLLFPPKEPTRGAIGAFFGGLFLMALGYGLYRVYLSQSRLLKRLVPVFLALLVLASVGIFQTAFVKDKINGFAQSSSWQARAVVWKMGFVSWQERPWLGWGQENFNIPFTKYFDPSLPLTADIWYDRVHNIVFDTLVTSGIIGLLSYLAIFVVAIFGLIKILPKITEKKNIFIPLGMISLLAAYFAQNIWVFDMISSYMMFFLALAFISFLITSQEVQPASALSEGKLKRVAPFVGGLLVVAGILSIWFGDIQPARASRYIIKGVSQKLEDGLPYFQKALDASPMAIIEAPEQFSRLVGNLTFNEKVDKTVLKQGYEMAAQDMKKAIEKNPEDFRFYLLLGKLYSDFFFVDRDPGHLQEAEQILTKAISMSPKNQQGYWSLSQVKISQGQDQQAIDFMQKSVDLEPRLGISHWYLAMTYKLIGRYQPALDEVAKAEKAGYDWKVGLDTLKKVIELYQETGNDQMLSDLYSLAIEKSPEDPRFWMGLSVSQANLGKFSDARTSAQKALSFKPSFSKEIEEFLASLPK